ncbi:MAG TPA: hypothetical protein VFJ06_04385, partial [Halococcus sp.]|nr:hypothetical protein [Halococcus sp.]
MSESIPEPAGDHIAELSSAHADYEEAAERVTERGERELRNLADAYDRATTLLDKYESRATGTGDFEGFIEFQESFERFVEGLDEDLPHREAFEKANECFDKRRLSESDFAAARNTLSPVAELTDLLTERETRREHYRETRRRVVARRDELDERIEELQRLRALGNADLNAPVGDLREPIEAYNERVAAAFRSFRHEASVREVLGFVITTKHYPLVSFRFPPTDLVEYAAQNAVGTETLPKLLDYADYSQSKLSHYVDNPEKLKRNVAVHRSYLDGLDAQPLVVGWPPPSADELQFRIRELISVVGRFAPAEIVTKLRKIRALARNERYERLRRASEARAALTADERTRLAEGAVETDLERARTERDRLH